MTAKKPTVSELDKRLTELSDQFNSLSVRFNSALDEDLEDHNDLQELKREIVSIRQHLRDARDFQKDGLTDEARKQLDTAFNRSAALEHSYNGLLNKINAIQKTVDNHDVRIAALEQNLAFGYDIRSAIELSGFTEDQFRQVLGINSDDDLDLDDVLEVISTRFAWQHETLVKTNKRVTELNTRVDKVTCEVIEFRENNLQSKPSLVPLVVGAIVAVLSYFFIVDPNWDRPFWQELLLSVGIGGLVCGALSFFFVNASNKSNRTSFRESFSEGWKSGKAKNKNTSEQEKDNPGSNKAAQPQAHATTREMPTPEPASASSTSA